MRILHVALGLNEAIILVRLSVSPALYPWAVKGCSTTLGVHAKSSFCKNSTSLLWAGVFGTRGPKSTCVSISLNARSASKLGTGAGGIAEADGEDGCAGGGVLVSCSRLQLLQFVTRSPRTAIYKKRRRCVKVVKKMSRGCNKTSRGKFFQVQR